MSIPAEISGLIQLLPKGNQQAFRENNTHIVVKDDNGDIYVIDKSQTHSHAQGGYGVVYFNLQKYNAGNKQLEMTDLVAKVLAAEPKESTEIDLLSKYYSAKIFPYFNQKTKKSSNIIIMPNIGNILGGICENDSAITNEDLKTFSFKQLVNVAVQIFLGINLFHHETPTTGKPFVHRDLKPNNILLKLRDAGFDVSVVDLGSAHVFNKEGEKITDANITGSTDGFIASEVLDLEFQDVTSDIYSLGITIAFLFKAVFSSKKIQAISDKYSGQNFIEYDFDLFADTIEGGIPLLVDGIPITLLVETFVRRMCSGFLDRPDSDECLMFFSTLLSLCELVDSNNTNGQITEELKYQQYLYIAKLRLINEKFYATSEGRKYIENLGEYYDVTPKENDNSYQTNKVVLRSIAKGCMPTSDEVWNRVKKLEVPHWYSAKQQEQFENAIKEIVDYTETAKILSGVQKLKPDFFIVDDNAQLIQSHLSTIKKDVQTRSSIIWGEKYRERTVNALEANPKLRSKLFAAYEDFDKIFPETPCDYKFDYKKEASYRTCKVKHEALRLIQSKYGFFNSAENNQLLAGGMQAVKQAQSIDGVVKSLENIQRNYQPRHSLFVLLDKIKTIFSGRKEEPVISQVVDSQEFSTRTAKEIEHFKQTYQFVAR